MSPANDNAFTPMESMNLGVALFCEDILEGRDPFRAMPLSAARAGSPSGLSPSGSSQSGIPIAITGEE